jgi:hypothetical protein
VCTFTDAPACTCEQRVSQPGGKHRCCIGACALHIQRGEGCALSDLATPDGCHLACMHAGGYAHVHVSNAKATGSACGINVLKDTHGCQRAAPDMPMDMHLHEPALHQFSTL